MTTGQEKGGLLFSLPAFKYSSVSGKFLICVVLVFILTLFLRIYKIDQKNLWFDEVYSWNISTEPAEQLIATTSGDIHPPFYYLVLKTWNMFFGDSIFSMRMLSVVLSMLSFILILSLSGKFLRNNLHIIFVLLLYAVSPLNIYYSQEVRMQNLNLFLCLGSVVFFFRFSENLKIKDGLVYSLFTILALYTHYFSFLILLTELFLMLFIYYKSAASGRRIKILKRYPVFFILINLFYIPWYPVMVAQAAEGQPWRTSQDLSQVSSGIVDFIKDFFLSYYINFESSAAITISSFFSLFFLIFLLYSFLTAFNKGRDAADNTIIIFSFVLIPLAAAIAISTSQSLLISRYLSITLPYLLLGIIYLFFRIYKRIIAFVIIGIIFTVSCFGTYLNYENKFKNNDYRKIISHLEENFSTGDEIITEPHFMGWAINYYVLHNETNLKKPLVFGWDLNSQADSLGKRDDLQNIWFILDYSSLEKSNYDSLPVYMDSMGYSLRDTKHFYLFPEKVKVEYYVK